MSEASKILLAYYFQCNGKWDEIFKALSKKKRVYKKYLEHAEKTTAYITLLDDKYPEVLKSLFKPPFAFRYNGHFHTHENYVFVINPKGIMPRISYHPICYIQYCPGDIEKYKICFSDCEAAYYASSLSAAVAIATSISKMSIIDNKCSKGMATLISSYRLSCQYDDLLVQPSLKSCPTNDLIKAGATLYDSESDIDNLQIIHDPK